MARIDERQVISLVRRCFAAGEIADRDVEPPLVAIRVDGWNAGYFFHPDRVTEAAAEVSALVAELTPRLADPDNGTPLPDICIDADEETWGSMESAHALFCLAIAAGLGGFIEYQAGEGQTQRDVWASLPGGVPNVWMAP